MNGTSAAQFLASWCETQIREVVLSAPAFWVAPGSPASPNQRGDSVVTERAVTALIERKAACY